MGNSMHLAQRMQSGPDLEWRLEREIALLDIEHPGGFVVRLHILGDFYSVGYVQMWTRLLDQHPALHVFGYTARHDAGDPIAVALIELVKRQWDRFAVRFSNAQFAPATITVEHPLQVLLVRCAAPNKPAAPKAARRAGFAGQRRSASPSFSTEIVAVGGHRRVAFLLM